MGITCKPIGKLASIHRKLSNELLKEKNAQKKATKKEKKANE